MAKAPRPPKEPPVPTPSDDPAGPESSEPVCWTFVPVELGPVASSLSVGDKLRGAVVSTRVQVNSDLGFVGVVPRAEGREIIALVQDRERRLVGQVVSNTSGVLIVELCAI